MTNKSNQELLNEVIKDIEDNLVCELKDAATNLVFGKGNAECDILIIGEAPGAKEDIEGYPFVGRAGKNLDKLLNIINLNLDDVYIANILKYRPPKNRDPTKDEMKNHTPYLIKQIKIIKPKIIATLGNYSTKFVLSGFDSDNMKKVKGDLIKLAIEGEFGRYFIWFFSAIVVLNFARDFYPFMFRPTIKVTRSGIWCKPRAFSRKVRCDFSDVEEVRTSGRRAVIIRSDRFHLVLPVWSHEQDQEFVRDLILWLLKETTASPLAAFTL